MTAGGRRYIIDEDNLCRMKSAARGASHVAVFDDTSRVLCTSGRATDATCLPLALRTDDVPAFSRRLPLLRSLVVELSPERSLAFLLDPRRMDAFSSWRDRREAEHVGCCVRDILWWDWARGLERLGGRGLAPGAVGGFAEGLLTAMRIIELAGEGDLSALRSLMLERARTRDAKVDEILYAASEGLVLGGVNRVVSAMARGTTADVRRSVLGLIRARGSMGADALVGLYMTLRSRLPAPQAPRRHPDVSGRAAGPREVGWS